MNLSFTLKDMSKMRYLAIAVLACGSVVCPNTWAASFTWTLTGGAGAGSTGNSMTFGSDQSGGPSVTANAWYLTGLGSPNPNTTGTLQKAALGQYSNGLAVCNVFESCTQPEHQLDNNVNYEFILFKFSASVDPTSVTITTTSSADLDISYWVGNVAVSDLTGQTLGGLGALGFGSRLDNDSTSTSSRSASITSGFVNALLLGARVNGDANLDYFKVGLMGGDTPGTQNTIPEPSSVALLGTVLFGIATLLRKRRAA